MVKIKVIKCLYPKFKSNKKNKEKKTEQFILGNLNVKRDFIFIDDH